jgi:hypothetical protein
LSGLKSKKITRKKCPVPDPHSTLMLIKIAVILTSISDVMLHDIKKTIANMKLRNHCTFPLPIFLLLLYCNKWTFYHPNAIPQVPVN